VEVEPVSFSAVSFACRTQITPLPFSAGAALAVGAATTQAATKQSIKSRMGGRRCELKEMSWAPRWS
jgi:hypothetical protein